MRTSTAQCYRSRCVVDGRGWLVSPAGSVVFGMGGLLCSNGREVRFME